MWFVFPQLGGLGSSSTLVNRVDGRSIEEIFGYPDHLKFRSCLTLFAHAAADADSARVFRAALTKYFGGEEDALTLRLLSSSAS